MPTAKAVNKSEELATVFICELSGIKLKRTHVDELLAIVMTVEPEKPTWRDDGRLKLVNAS